MSTVSPGRTVSTGGRTAKVWTPAVGLNLWASAAAATGIVAMTIVMTNSLVRMRHIIAAHEGAAYFRDCQRRLGERYPVNVSSASVFLLSPAYCGGRRAGYLMRDGSDMVLARRLAAGGLTLGEAFAFMSGLYFRGKLAYAQCFGTALVITPTRGLQSPDSLVTVSLLREFAEVDVDADDQRYREPLDRDLRRLVVNLAPDARVVLLGSIATGKYVDALTAVCGQRLHYPSAFVGRGDMSRGGLMLRSVADNHELDYTLLATDSSRHGPRPPKLAPRPGIAIASASTSRRPNGAL